VVTPTRATAAVAVGDRRFEPREFDIPRVADSDGLLRVEACGVCGSDLKKFRPVELAPAILGHETVGRIERLGAVAADAWGVREGDRVLLEEYLPCGHCSYCRSGEFRSCRETDNAKTSFLRYGSMPTSIAPALWGGYAQFQYLHPRSVLHRVPDSVEPHHATFGIPMSNGIQWVQMDGGVRAGDVVVVQGPGQQGLGCVLASRYVGADLVIATGLTKDARRLDLAKELGADATVDVETQDLVEAVRDLTGGRMADVVIDVSGGGLATVALALGSVRKGGVVVSASGANRAGGDGVFDLDRLRKQQITVRGVRGHSYAAVETALSLIARGDLPMPRICSAPFGLGDIDAAFQEAAGRSGTEAPHVSISPS
jgi:threonine dehydrogenase-like Zn-dependent dehydrogenase